MVRFVKYWLRVLRFAGLYGVLRYSFAPSGKLLTIPIRKHNIWVRKGTPDLFVALTCLTGEFEILRHLLPTDYSGVIVDAGGYIGTATLALRDMFPSAKIVVVEPSEVNIRVLKKNLSGQDNVQIVYGALVGRNVESVELKDPGGREWGFTAVESPQNCADTPTLHDTPAFMLSSLVADVSDIGILKLDIEGGEYDLLQNDRESLQKIGVVFAELHDKQVDGCTELFFEYSKGRALVKDRGEKYLSIKR